MAEARGSDQSDATKRQATEGKREEGTCDGEQKTSERRGKGRLRDDGRG